MAKRTTRSAESQGDFAFGQGELPLGSKFKRPREEQALVNIVGEWAAQHGHLPMRLNNGATRVGESFIRFVRFWKMRGETRPTIKLAPPDMMVQHGETGVWVSMEMKDLSGCLSEEQKKFGAEVARRGGIFAVVRTLEDAQRVMRAAGKGKTESEAKTHG